MRPHPPSETRSRPLHLKERWREGETVPMLAFLIRRILQTVPIPPREMLGDGDDGMCMRGSAPPGALAGAALHCHSVSYPIGAVPLVREQIQIGRAHV